MGKEALPSLILTLLLLLLLLHDNDDDDDDDDNDVDETTRAISRQTVDGEARR